MTAEKLSLPGFSMSNLRKNRPQGAPESPSLFSDVTLRVGQDGEPYPALRAILACASSFLRRKFESWTAEETQMAEVIFEPKDMTHEALGAVIEILYDGEVELSWDNVFDLHTASNFLGIEVIAARCLDFLKKGMSLETVVPVWVYSRGVFTGSQELSTTCLDFIEQNFPELAIREDFLNLDFDGVCQVASVRGLSEWKSGEVLDFVLRWMHQDWKSRFEYAEDLVEMISWDGVDLASAQTLGSVKMLRERECESSEEKLAEYGIIKKLVGASSSFDSARMGSTLGADIYCIRRPKPGSPYKCRCFDIEKLFWTNETSLAYQVDQSFAILKALNFRNTSYVVVRTSPDVQTLHKFEHRRISLKSVARFEHAIPITAYVPQIDAGIGSKGWVYLLWTGCRKLLVYDINTIGLKDEVELLDPYIQCDDLFADPGFKTRHHSVALVEDWLIIFGGVDPNTNAYEQATKMLNLKTKVWQDGPAMKHCVKNPGIAVHGKDLFVSGGICGAALNSVYHLDSRSMKWSHLPPLLLARYDHHMVVCAPGHLVVFGGRNGTAEGPLVKTAERLDLANVNSGWQEFPAFEGVQADFAVVV